MNNYRWLMACSAIACLIPLGGLAYQDSSASGQQETAVIPVAPAFPTVPAAPAAPQQTIRWGVTSSAPTAYLPGTAPYQAAYAVGYGGQSEGKLVRQIKEAENDEEREAAIDEARQQLEEVYDQYLESSEQQIEQLEQRLEELRSHLEKRREAKSRLVDLKLELLISQADGIGWPGDSRFPAGAFFSGATSPFPTQGGPGSFGTTIGGGSDFGLMSRVQQEVERVRAESEEAAEAIERAEIERARLRRGR